MSTYVTRFVEIKNANGQWELVKWLTKKSQTDWFSDQEIRILSDGEEMVVNDHFSDNATGVRDYLRDVWSYMGTHFKDRGVPEDASEELKKLFAEHTKPGPEGYDFTYNHSYYLLSELEDLLDKEIDFGWKSLEREIGVIGENEVKSLLRTVISNQAEIAKELPGKTPGVYDKIASTVPPTPEEDEEGDEKDTSDVLKYVRETYYEVVEGINGIQREVDNIYGIIFNGLNSYKPSSNIRVTFYFS